MKLKVNFLEKDKFEKELKEISHLDFSLFVESTPETEEELSSINILAIYEPNEYFGLHDWAIQNKNLFDVILTWDDKVLNNCDNALLLPFGHTWLKPNQYNKPNNKITVHYKGSCLLTENIEVQVPCNSKWNKQQPKLVIQGFCKNIIIEDKLIKII